MGIDLWFPPSLSFFFNEPWRYKAAYGGRGSAKSWTVADALIYGATFNQWRILCAREFQRSIADSVHHLLETQIDRLGFSRYFNVQNSSISCALTGSEFIFAGLKHNISSLKSLEGIDRCWVEEGEAVSDASWSILTPTIRKPGSEIWVTFNPDQESDPTYRRFVPGQPGFDAKRTKSVQVSWRDNPELPDVLRAELEHLRRTDPDAYQHVWEGGTWTRSDSQVFNGKWVIDDFVPVTASEKKGENWNGPYFGADWGFSQDPTTLLKIWVRGNRLYIEREAYAIGCDLTDTPTLFDKIEGSRKRKIRADCARPETIHHMKNSGFDCIAADKWTGSVEDGIAWIRGFEKVVIHPSCKHTAEEFRLYRYKTDKLTGDVLPDIIDRYNHCIDALRYGMQPMIRARGATMADIL